MAQNDLRYFLRELTYTKDEHDPTIPAKKYPWEEKPYLQTIAGIWLKTLRLLLPKSRQLLITWTTAACYLWDSMCLQNRLNFFQSKKETDAAAILERANFIYENLGGPDYEADGTPRIGKSLIKLFKPRASYTTAKGNCRLRFPTLSSQIWAIPEGADIIRSYTLSGWFCDETAFQANVDKAWQAARPALAGGGRFTGVSSANGKNYWFGLVYDLV